MVKVGRLRRSPAANIAGLVALSLAAGCAPGVADTPSLATATTVGTTIDVVATSPSPAAVGLTPSKPEPKPMVHLTLWTVESASPQAEGDAGRIFANGLRHEKEWRAHARPPNVLIPDVPFTLPKLHDTLYPGCR